MPFPKIKISDDEGNAVSVTGNRLDVNAAITVASDTIDIGDVEILGHAGSFGFTQNVTDSAVVLTSRACKHADIMATIANTGIVYIGAAGVSETTGIELSPGDVYSCDVINTNRLFCISTVSGDDINVVTYS